MSASMTAPPAGAVDPMAGAPMTGDDAGGASDADDNVICTIASDGQGGFIVYAGDEPEGGAEGSDMSEDDTDAMGAAGGAPAPNGGAPASQGQPADSVGAALKIVMGILQENQSSQGGQGSSDDQFASGFNASKSPTPATSMPQKF